MSRQTWRDLLNNDASTNAAPDAASGAAQAGTATPPSLDQLTDIPELQSLLSERARLQETLDRLTGTGSAQRTPEEERDARRFPPFRAPNRQRQDDRTRREMAEDQAMDIGSVTPVEPRPDTEPSPPRSRRRLSAAERAERARAAGVARVRAAEEKWEQHRERLIAARDLARTLVRSGRALGLPGVDVMDRELLRRAESLADGMDRVRERAESVGNALRSLEAGTRALSSLDIRRDSATAVERVTRRTRDVAERALRETEAGQRLQRLREELPAPVLRELSSEGQRSQEEVMEARRERALDALRQRRQEDPSSRAMRTDTPRREQRRTNTG